MTRVQRKTDLEWLDAIPSDWSEREIGREVWVRARLGWKGLTADEYVEDGIPMLATPDIKDPEIAYHAANKITVERYEESPEIQLRSGDVLLTKDGNTIGTVNVVRRKLPGPATVNGSIAVLTPARELDGRFLYWFIASSYAQSIFDRLRGGMGVPHLFQRDINRIRFPYPPLPEQRAIADYLDRETARIGTLIDEQQRLIEMLRERRGAVLSSVFEDGPATETTKVGRLLAARPSYGVLVPRYVDEAEGVPFVRVGDLLRLAPGRPLLAISPEQSDEYSRTKLVGGEVLLGVVGKMGQAALAPQWLAGANVARAVAVLRCSDPAVAPLLCTWLKSDSFLHQADLATSGDSIQPTLGMKHLARFDISLPTDPDAAVHLAAQLRRIDALIEETERFIQLSRERRSALVTAAVTGQIDVRGAA